MSNFITFVVSILLGLLGMGLLGFFLWVLATPCFGWLRGNKEARHLSRAMERIKQFDKFVEENKYREAISELRAAVVFNAPTSGEVVNSFREHYQNILSRILLLTEELRRHPDGLPEVEQLFFERLDLLGLHAKVNDTYTKLRTKRTSEGKDLPSWSKEDFEQRLTDVRQELARNRANLEDHLKILFAQFEKPAGDDQIVYH